MRWFRIFLIGLLILLLLPILGVTFFGTPIARSVVAAVNDRLQGEIRIDEYDIGFWQTFPDLSVNLRDVTVEGSDGSNLLRAGRLSLQLDVASLFGKVRVEKIVVRDGRLQLLTDPDGNTNFQLAGYTPVGETHPSHTSATTAEGGAELALAQAILQDIQVIVRDRQLDVDWAGKIEALTLSGDFGADRYLLTTDGSVYIDYLDQGGERYAQRQRLTLTAKTDVDRADDTYTLSPLSITAGELELNVAGTLQTTTEGLLADLALESTSGNLTDLIGLIPPAYVGTLDELETRGELTITATAKGNWTAEAYPRIEGRLSFAGGRVGSPRTNLGARDLNLEATFTYLEGPRGDVQSFSIEELTGYFRNQPFRLELLVEDLKDPHIRFIADGAYDLRTLPTFLGVGPLTDGDGYARLENVRLEGRYADMVRPRGMANVRASGRIRLDEGELTVNNHLLAFPSGTLELDHNKLRLQDLHFRAPGTDLFLTGEATNLIPVLFADSLNTNDAALLFTTELRGESLDLDELLAVAGPDEVATENVTDPASKDSLRNLTVRSRTYISDLLRGTFNAQIDEWAYGEIEGRNFVGQLSCLPGQLRLQGLTEAMGGELQVDGKVAIGERLRFSGWVAGGAVDVTEFFRQGEAFSQEVITHENLRGQMDARLWIEAAFDEEGDFDYPALRVLADMRIHDGELRDFPLLNNLSFALKSGDLERIRFTELTNYFEIDNETLYLPLMSIRSSALNLELAGAHSFEQDIAYYLKVNAGQAIANKLARHDEELEILPERRGWFNLYYSLLGPLETFAVERDKRGVKQAFGRSVAHRERIRRELEGRFAGATVLVETNR